MTTKQIRNKRVTAIPATKIPGHTTVQGTRRRRRVAAYARVSTEMEEQASSYEAQIDYYTSHIQSRTEWEFAGMYADEGITGTSTKHREGFKTMIADTLAGKIDLILTKSVSRFARNTVDTLIHVRQLKDKGVEVYFEKENIWTLDSKGELLITIMSSLTQEESRSISENVTWDHRKRFADGKIMVPYASLLGYKKGEDGNLAIDETQAPTVRRIYARFLEGATPQTIAKEFTSDGIPTPRGKQIWSPSTVRSILANEKYKGDALLQKSFTTDFLTKPRKSTKAKYPSTTSPATTNPSLIPSPGTPSKQNSPAAQAKAPPTPTPSPTRSPAPIAAGGLGGKSGTPPANTAATSGAATTNTTRIITARHPTSPKTRSKTPSSQPWLSGSPATTCSMTPCARSTKPSTTPASSKPSRPRWGSGSKKPSR